MISAQHAQAEIDALVAKFGLRPIEFRINNRLTVLGGRATYHPRIIEMPQWMMDCDEALDTVRHEVAHFLALQLYGPREGHGRGWKECAVACGAAPTMYCGLAAEGARPERKASTRRSGRKEKDDR